MSIRLQGSINFHLSSVMHRGLKSTQQKMERQNERDNKVAFFEKQKENLKNMKGDSLEEISKKLDLLHSYEDQIAAAKAEYNNSQMLHVMDEAEELGEKIAEEAKKNAPKTAEERREEMVEEALGIEDEKGALTENLEEISELAEEMTEEVVETQQEEVSESIGEQQEEMQESMEELQTAGMEAVEEQKAGQDIKYKRFDVLI